MNRIKLFTHSDLDGIGCAVLAFLVFGRENVEVEYCGYDNVDGKIREFYLCNQEPYDAVYITDISVDDEVAEEIDGLVNAVGYKTKWHLLDHHATALRLNEHIWADVRVEMEDGVQTCGTELFYEHLMENGYFEHYTVAQLQNIHRFVEIVRDYDTWRWKTELGEEGIVCKQVNDLFHIYGREEFIEWCMDRLIYFGSYPEFPCFGQIDEVLLNQKQKEIDIYVAQKDKQLTTMIDKFGYTYGVVFAERYASELGNRLSETHNELDYIVMIDISTGTVHYRTVKDDIDLGGEIAHSFGGGGHRKAAGSTFDSDIVKMLVLNEVFGDV